MQRKRPFYLLGMSFAFLVACTPETPLKEGCDKNETVDVAYWMADNHAKGGGSIIGLNFYAGHAKEDCDGSCSDERSFHRDCQGSGRKCNLLGGLELEPMIPKSGEMQCINYIGRCLYPEDISDDEIFAMPARSLRLENVGRWINIPEQILERDSKPRCFVVKNITFTDVPVYENI